MTEEFVDELLFEKVNFKKFLFVDAISCMPSKQDGDKGLQSILSFDFEILDDL